jgi:hypothetical protein
MTQKQIAMIKELEANVKAIAGDAAAETVMKGAGDLKASTNKAKLAEWVKGAMERLDSTVPKDQRAKIMAACGRNCARINHRAIEMFRKRRAHYISLDDFLNAEAKSPMKGTKLWREKGAVVQAYCPSEYTRPMRCYCALVNGLPANKTMSATYCQCSRAFVQQMWEETLGQPVSVTLLKSAVAGAKECHFQINFKE